MPFLYSSFGQGLSHIDRPWGGCRDAYEIRDDVQGLMSHSEARLLVPCVHLLFVWGETAQDPQLWARKLTGSDLVPRLLLSSPIYIIVDEKENF